MAVTAALYGLAQDAFANGDIDFTADTIKVALLDSGYTPAQDTHNFFDDVSAEEVAGTGYTAGGATLASKTVGYTAGTNTTKLDAADPAWPASDITARYAVFYKWTGSAATSPLICYWNFGADFTSTAGTFTLQLNAGGIVTFVAAAEA